VSAYANVSPFGNVGMAAALNDPYQSYGYGKWFLSRHCWADIRVWLFRHLRSLMLYSMYILCHWARRPIPLHASTTVLIVLEILLHRASTDLYHTTAHLYFAHRHIHPLLFLLLSEHSSICHTCIALIFHHLKQCLFNWLNRRSTTFCTYCSNSSIHDVVAQMCASWGDSEYLPISKKRCTPFKNVCWRREKAYFIEFRNLAPYSSIDIQNIGGW